MSEIVFKNSARFFIAGLIMLGLFSCANQKKESALPYYNTPDFTPYWFNNQEEAAKKITHVIDDFSFQDEEGTIITRKNVEGKIHVANFFFTTCPSVCPKMTIQFQGLQKAFEKDSNVLLLSYSVTPWKDSVARLKEYAENYEVNPEKWHLLTGNKSTIYNLARQSYFAEEEIGYTKDSTQFLHTEHFILVDKSGRIRGIYNGTLPLETERLIADIKNVRLE